jgi:hypothetical protein
MNYEDTAAVRRSVQCRWPLHGPIAVFVLILCCWVSSNLILPVFIWEFTGLDGTGAIGNRRCDAFLLCVGRTDLWKQFVPYGFLHIWGRAVVLLLIVSTRKIIFFFCNSWFSFSSFDTLVL